MSAVGLGVVGLFVYARYFKVQLGYEPLQFNSVEWKGSDADVRGYMARDLESRGLLYGKDRAAVIALLGKPDRTLETTVEYDLGYMGYNPTAIMVQSFRLLVMYDEQGMVENVVITD